MFKTFMSKCFTSTVADGLQEDDRTHAAAHVQVCARASPTHFRENTTKTRSSQQFEKTKPKFCKLCLYVVCRNDSERTTGIPVNAKTARRTTSRLQVGKGLLGGTQR